MKFPGHSIIRLLANSEVKDNRLTWNHIEISLHFEDADVHFVNSPTSEIGTVAGNIVLLLLRYT